MGFKDLFQTKKATDKISKFFIDQGITIENKNGAYKFELYLNESGYSLYPYFSFNEATGDLSILINVRKITEEEFDYSTLNSFNLISEYFTAKLKNKAIFLEYNTKASVDNIKEILEKALESIFSLQEDIDKL